MMVTKTDISVVVPVKNESGNVTTLIQEIDDALKNINYEIIYVNDGSSDSTENDLINALKINKRLRVINHKTSQGQSAALRTGVYASRSILIGTLDGDGQNNPSDLPGMISLNKKSKKTVHFNWRS